MLRMKPTAKHLVIACCIGSISSPLLCHADDWPQWLGPQGDSIWRESGIIGEIPEGGLKFKWRHGVGLGYAGPAVAGGRVFVLDYEKTSGEISNRAGWKDELEGKERILCFSSGTGDLLWKYEYPRPYHLSFPSGPRSTPTVAEGKVYSLGAEGNLVCLSATTGGEIWSVSFNEKYDTETPHWGYSAHPLVVGDTLYCVVGGEGSVAVAFDKNTGEEKWRALTAAEPGYCPPTLIDHGGRQQLLIWHPEGLNSLNPSTGEVYWTADLRPSYGFSVCRPRLHGSLLFASGMRATGLLKLNEEKPGFELLWRGSGRNAVYAGISTPFFDGEMVYGCDIESGALMGVRARDGKRLWETKIPTVGNHDESRHGTAFIVHHSGSNRYFLFNEKGELILSHLTPEGYHETGRAKVLEPTNYTGKRPVVWSHPAFAEKSLFARNDKEIVCVDLAASSYGSGKRSN